MRLFPAFFRTDDTQISVFGGGEEARRKVRLLAKSTAKITVICAPEIDAAFLQEFTGRISVRSHDQAESVLSDSKLAIIACRNPAHTERAISLARRKGVPINVVDQPDQCDFTVPSLLQRGELVAAIGTGGAAPVLAKRIRTQMETLLPQNLGPLTEIARTFRPRVSAVLNSGRARRLFWEDALNGAPAELALAGRLDEVNTALEDLLQTHSERGRQNNPPPVHLVGAGPGDPELLTLKAFRLLQTADIVFHDRLVSPEILDLIRRDADRVSVGKARANHSVPQSEIHLRMIAAARKGLRVVRLKGGDPFIFGRGGEEVEALVRAGLQVEIVPGISAALGCAASIGLPLTHRDHAQSLVFVTGHKKSGGLPDLDWHSLARPAQTVVVFMGVGTAGHISSHLIAAGRAASTPVAIIQNGTRPDESTQFGTLAELPVMAERCETGAPALLIIGEVSALPAEALSQFAQEIAA